MKKTVSALPALSKFDLLILGLLCGRPMHGYELNQILGSEEMAWVDICRSSTYKALDRVKKQDLVVESLEEQADKPLKSVFYVTNKGREAFFENLRRLWLQPPKVSFEEHIGVFFLNLLSEEEAARLLEMRLDSLKVWASPEGLPLDHQTKIMEFSSLPLIRKRLNQFAGQEIAWYEELAAALTGKSQKDSQDRIPAFAGSLKEFELINIVKLLVDGRRTGTLSLMRNLNVNGLHFKEGHILGVSKQPAEAEGLAAKHQSELSSGRSDKASSLLPEIYAAFSSSDGRFSFDSAPIDDYIPVKLTTLEFLREGSRRINDWETIRTLVPSQAVVFDWEIERSSTIVSLGVSDEEKKVLAEINGMRSVDDIMSLTGLSLFRVSKALYVYSQLGAIVAVAGDGRALLEAFRNVVKLLLDGTNPILTKRESAQLAAEATNLANQENLQFEIQDGRLIEKIVGPVDIVELEDLTKSFLKVLVDQIKAKLGQTVVDDLLEGCREQLAPEASEIMTRYGLI